MVGLTIVICVVQQMAGVATICIKLLYYTLWQQDLWRYVDPLHMQKVMVISAIIYNK